MIKKHLKSKGFTLVETLIAIAILMVAIAGPLTIASKALTVALGSRNAMIATYLAQDAMESIRNLKDNNLAGASFSWSNVVNSACTGYVGSIDWTKLCPVPSAWSINAGTIDFNSPSADTCNSVNSCLLYTDNSGTKKGYYNLTSASLTANDRPSPFTRYYYVVLNPNGKEATVTIVVSWIDNSIPNAITLQELMTNIPR